jgi:hypothetical protein
MWGKLQVRKGFIGVPEEMGPLERGLALDGRIILKGE